MNVKQQKERKVNKFINKKDTQRDIKLLKTCFTVLKAYLGKKKLEKKELQIINYCKLKIKKLKLRRLFKALKLYVAQTNQWVSQVKRQFQQQTLQNRFIDILNNAQAERLQRRRHIRIMAKIFRYLQYQKNQSLEITREVLSITDYKMVDKSFKKMKRYYKCQSRLQDIEKRLKRRYCYKLKSVAFGSLRFYTQRIKNANNDRILKRFAKNESSFFDDKGDIVLLGDEEQDNFFQIQALSSSQYEYGKAGEYQNKTHITRRLSTHIAIIDK
ncbi:UNKNOWN [Stylonychia lemnae]|uniref:Uncharacterized protein n=1 Tax=Stylonychia lemnae TaxID=5949 RepID=A0A078A796_STYLE|nr:UNKNOWN [Stylonychia lemnae]|eukprot:CDW78125.1 UNKNOWN [Stylonychia lemnae]